MYRKTVAYKCVRTAWIALCTVRVRKISRHTHAHTHWYVHKYTRKSLLCIKHNVTRTRRAYIIVYGVKCVKTRLNCINILKKKKMRLTISICCIRVYVYASPTKRAFFFFFFFFLFWWPPPFRLRFFFPFFFFFFTFRPDDLDKKRFLFLHQNTPVKHNPLLPHWYFIRCVFYWYTHKWCKNRTYTLYSFGIDSHFMLTCV